MTRILLSLLALAAAGALAASAGAAGASSAQVVIRHQYRGCHAWSVNGSPYKAAQSVKLAVGGTLTVSDNDVMAHLLLQKSGPAKVAFAKLPSAMRDMATPLHGPGLMAHMGAAVKVTFPKAGTYTFTTKPGEDYMPGVQTVGEDNTLKLKVIVGPSNAA